MISKLARAQLVVFAIVGIVAIVVVGGKYARLDKLVGIGQYHVTVEMTESGGIFSNAQVTYQGVPVGRVGEMRLTPAGVDVVLDMDSGAPKVPDTAVAVVANRSAIGEQYIDLQPTTAGAPYLTDGSVITETKVPPPLEDVVSAAIDFTDSVPVDDLQTVITELGKAFDGRVDDVTRLVDSLDRLSAAGVEHLGQTISLIENSNVVLATQSEQSDEILRWAEDINLVAAQLASSDQDVRRLLQTGVTSATELSALIRDSGGDITAVVDDLAATVNEIAPTSFNTGYTVAMLSALSAGSHSPAPGDGQIHFGVVLETNNPAACTRGYEGTTEIINRMKAENPDFDVNYDDFPFNTEAGCTVPFGNPTGVRSAQRAEYSNPAQRQPWDNVPKKDPDRLNLNPLAQQLAALLGVRPR